MTGGNIQPAPFIIARRAGLRVEQRSSDFGPRFTIYDQGGAMLYRTNRRENALAWVEGYTAGAEAAGQ